MIITRIARRLRNERGMVLVLALGVLIAVSATSVAIIEYTSSNSRSTSHGKGQQLAFGLAEAGINNAMAVLSQPPNNALSQDTLPACTGNPQSSWNTNDYEGGRVDWCGDLNLSEAAWYLTSIGVVANPGGSEDTTRKLTAYVPVSPVVNQEWNVEAWNYIFATATGSTCDMTLNEGVTIESALFVNGNLCLNNNSYVLVGPLVVQRRLHTGQTESSVGTSSARVDVWVGGYDGKWCKTGVSHWHPDTSHSTHENCSDVDKVYGKLADGSPGVRYDPPSIGLPTTDWDRWYADAMPGPGTACTYSEGTVPTWDNNTVRDNSVGTAFNLTPNASYLCRVGPADNPVGLLQWDYNASTGAGKLTVQGVVFIDGSAYASNGLLNEYDGRATIYLSGTLKFGIDTKLCGVVNGSNCAQSPGPPEWDPNEELLVFVTNSQGGQVPAGYGIQVDNNAQFQGGLYATYGILYGNNSRSDGPIIGSTITFTQNYKADAFGTITVTPPGMPGSPNVYAQPNSPELFSG